MKNIYGKNVILLVFIQILRTETSIPRDLLVVTISSGKIRGKILKDKNGGEFYAFQKIPYGKKPIGKLRFKALEKPEKWNGTLDATQVAPDCIHNVPNCSEDCIYLNVFTHRKSKLRPVMVYIYGGALTTGSSNPETTLGPEFLLTKDIVLVTFNYRLGILGFLNYEYPENEDIDLNSLDNQNIADEISSNNGFKDQVFALQWVQENIAKFGGDKNKVTIFGQSAGASSVHSLLLSPLTKNLFHRAILQSGTALRKGLSINNSAVYLGNYLGLDTKNTTNLFEGLRNLTEKEIQDIQNDLDIYKLTIENPTIAAIVIEKPGPNSFMPENPWKLIQSGKYHRIPMMFGHVDAEGILFDVHNFLRNSTEYFDIESFVPYYYNDRDIAAKKIDQKYFPTRNYSDIYSWIDMWSYSIFNFDIFRCVFDHLKWSNLYFYEFVYDTELNWSKKRAPRTSKLEGACHGDELGYLFKKKTTPKFEKGSEMDIAIERMVTMWTNFAIYGKPIKPGFRNKSLFGEQKWLLMKKDVYNVFQIGENLSQGVLNTTTFAFWKKLYDNYSSKIV